MGTRRLLFAACSLFIFSCVAQEAAKPKVFAAPVGINAVEVDGDVKKYFKIGAARDGIQKAILDEVLPAGDHNNFIDDEIEDPGAYDEEVTEPKQEHPLFIPRLYRNETAEEKAATATTRTTTTTTTTTPRPATRPTVPRTVIENLVTDIPHIVPHVQPQLPPQPLPPTQPRVQQPHPQVFPPQQPQPHVPVAPQTLPPQNIIPQQTLPQQPRQPVTQLPPTNHAIPQQPLPQQPQIPPFVPQVPQHPEQFTATPQALPTAPVLPPVRPQQPAPLQQPQPPQHPQPRPHPPPTTPARNLLPFQPRPQPPRPQDPTGLRTGVCRQSIFYITAPVHPVDTHLTFTHFAAVVSVDQCARTCHEFNCAIAHYDPATGHCQFNPSTVFSIREGQCPRWPANHYKNNYVSNQAIRIFCIACQRGRRNRNRNTGRSFLSHRDVHGFVRRPKNKAFQPTVIGRAASTHFNVHGVILRQPQSTAIGLGPFTQRENSFLVKKSNDDIQQQLVQLSDDNSTSATTVGEVTSPESSPVTPSEETAATDSTIELESTSASPVTEESLTETEPEPTTTRRPRRKLHRASGIATHIRRIAPLDHH